MAASLGQSMGGRTTLAIRFLCIFGTPRTGSSHLNKLLKSCPEFIAKGELFHGHGIGRHSRIEYAKLKEISDGVVTDGESFRAWRREHPMETLEALHSAWGSKIIAFKLFPNHLSQELIALEVFPRSDMAFAVLRRRPVESYISTVKARRVGVYGRTDTTELKPELSAEDFMEWARRVRGWFKWVRNSLEARNSPFAQIGFEKHLSGLPGEEAIAHLRGLLRPTGIANISVPDKVIEGKRQDRELDYKSRVANWDVFETELRASPQFSRMLDWAERVF